MLCLPQAFELFLKHLVGGLHTVYTKCKRLDIVPLVCNVEQVRVLRSVPYHTIPYHTIPYLTVPYPGALLRKLGGSSQLLQKLQTANVGESQ